MDLITPKRHWYRRHNNHNPTIDTEKLTTYRDVQKVFVEYVSSKLPNTPYTESSWVHFGAVLQEAAKETIGLRLPSGHKRKTAMEDPEVKLMVEEVRKLGMEENAARTRSQKAEKRAKLRRKRRELTTMLRRKGRQNLEKKVKNEGRKMFAALRALNIRPQNVLSINDKDGRTIHDINSQVDLLTSHFESQFSPNNMTNVIQHQGTLQYPISHEEVQAAAAKLKNHRASGPDSIPNELLKYACICDMTAQ